MAHDYPKIPVEQHAHIFKNEILIEPWYTEVNNQERPRAIIMAGQPGAGKGGLVNAAKAELHHDVVTIDPDELRNYHPQINNLRQQRPYSWSGETQGDASAWANELRDAAIKERKNIIVDTTMPRADIIQKLQAHGYDVEVRAIATHRLESELGVDKRFSEQLVDRGYGRYVPQELRDKVYQQLPNQLDSVSSKTGAPVRIFNRQGQELYDSLRQPDVSPGQALNAAREARMTPQRLAEVEQGIGKQQQFHRELSSQIPNAQVDPTTADNVLKERQAAQVEPRLSTLASDARAHAPHLATRPVSGANTLETVERPTLQPHSRLPSSTVLKGLGVAGTAYGVAQGIIDTNDAIDLAKSNREQWVRGAEAGADVAARGVVTGAAATVGAIPGAAVGTLTSPVTGPVGPVAGALATGGAAAYGADKAYDESRLQTFAKSFGRSVGEMGYDYVSREGRLLREVNGLKQDLQVEADPARRQAIETQLSGAHQRFSTEAERNSRYFEGRGTIEQNWDKIHAQFPKLHKDDVTNALSQHIDAGKPATDAAKAAYSDAVHEKYPRALPHQPAENYQTMGNDQLLERHSTHTGKWVEHRQQAHTHMANTDSRNNLDQGWPRALAEQRQAGRVESSLNDVWKDTGHVSAIREAMQARGMTPPKLPAELQRQRGQDAQPSPAQPAHKARDDLRAHENLERSMERAQPTSPSQSPSASPPYTARAISATHEHHFQIAQNRLAPRLRERGLDREEIERVSAAAVFQAEQHAGRGGIQGVYLSKDGQRVAVRQELPPISEFSVNTALTQTKDQHLERAQIVAHTQTEIQIPAETRQEQGRNQDAAPSSFSAQHMTAASPAAAEASARAMA